MSKFFSKGFDADGLTEPKDALVRALEIEKLTWSYYVELARHLDNPPQLEKITAAESQHIEALMQVLLTDARFRGLADEWPA